MEGRGIQPYMFEPPAPLHVQEQPIVAQPDLSNRLCINSSIWCLCGSCTTMQKVKECVCCKELDTEKTTGLSCIVEHPVFDIVVLNTDVLRTALVGMADVRCDSFEEPIQNRTWRLAAYRQFTWWVHKKLGKGVRRVVPSCVVNTIRGEFPEPDGNYVGYEDVQEAWPVYYT